MENSPSAQIGSGHNLPSANRSVTNQLRPNQAASANPKTISKPATPPPSKWTCATCHREMQEAQKEDHLVGKPHTTRLKHATAPIQEATENGDHYGATTDTATKARKGKTKPVFVFKAKPQRSNVGGTGGVGMRQQSTASASHQAGTEYPSDHSFLGFSGSMKTESYWNEGDLLMGGEDYAACDKDCGWCGRCMDGVDV